MKYIFVIVHSHKYGETYYLLKSDTETQPTIDTVVKLHGIDFEPDKDETINIERFALSEVLNFEQ